MLAPGTRSHRAPGTASATACAASAMPGRVSWPTMASTGTRTSASSSASGADDAQARDSPSATYAPACATMSGKARLRRAPSRNSSGMSFM